MNAAAKRTAGRAAERFDASLLDVTVTEGERCRRTIRVAVPTEVVDAERMAVVRRYASRVKMRGFRKGRIPSRVILQHYGRAIDEETVEASVRKACDGAIAANGLHPVTDVEVKGLRFEPGEDLSFEASFDNRPEVPLGRLGGFKVERPRPVVPNGAVDEILARLQREHAAWRTEETGRPDNGDSVTVLLTRLDGDSADADDSDADDSDVDRRYDLVLGQGHALPDVEDAIRTLEPGAGDEFDIAFPEDFPDEDRRGQSRRIRIDLLSRHVPELPELDDAFAGSVGDFEDLETLKTRIGEDLDSDARARAESELRDRLLRLVVEANDFEVPDSMVEGYTDAVIGEAEGVDPDKLGELRKELLPASQLAVKRELLVERILDEHGLRPTEEEVNARVDELAQGTNQSRGRLLARLRKSGGLRNIERTLTETRLFDFLKSRSDITDAQ
ncbi:MAG: trigger factor [Gemmatimonadetes bacterium]|nr:trigger factor [Gemmatimonadota bacterium]